MPADATKEEPGLSAADFRSSGEPAVWSATPTLLLLSTRLRVDGVELARPKLSDRELGRSLGAGR